MKVLAFRFALGVLLVLIVALVFVKLRYGGGAAYPALPYLSTAPTVPQDQVETLVSLPFPPGNVAVAASGRTFFAYHPFAQAKRFSGATVFELVDGVHRPYPSPEFQERYQGVFGMTVDKQSRLWVVEPAGLDFEQTRVIAFDLQTNTLVFEFSFPAKAAQFAQDLRVTPDGQALVLADTGFLKFIPPGLVVLDVASKTYRTLLSHEPAAQPQDWRIRTAKGPQRLAFGLVSFSVGLDGIEFSRDGQWLYFAAISHEHLFKLPTAALLDTTLSASALSAQIVPVARKPLSDGITVDALGNVLITDVEHGGIALLNTQGELSSLTRSAQVIWADGVVVTPDGQVLFTDSAIPAYFDELGRPPSAAALAAAAPYKIYRFKPRPTTTPTAKEPTRDR